VSQFFIDNLAASGLRHRYSVVILSGVDVRRVKPGPKVDDSTLALGRLVEIKRPLETIRAAFGVGQDVRDAMSQRAGGSLRPL